MDIAKMAKFAFGADEGSRRVFAKKRLLRPGCTPPEKLKKYWLAGKRRRADALDGGSVISVVGPGLVRKAQFSLPLDCSE